MVQLDEYLDFCNVVFAVRLPLKGRQMKAVRQLASAALVGCLIVGAQPTARAEDRPEPSIVSAAVDSIAAVDESLVGSAANVDTDDDGRLSIAASVNGVDISVPTDLSDGIAMDTDRGGIEVELPFADDASTVEVADQGIALYDNNNGSLTAPIVRKDGTVQVNTIISTPDAPTAYPYDFGLPTGTTIERVGGSLLFMSDGKLVGGLASAWAKDAVGRDVPIRYEVAGTQVTQVVDHSASFAYPIVADPWMGI